MTTLKRVSPGSAFKVGLVIYALIGLVLGAFCSAMFLVGAQVFPHTSLPMSGAMGLLAIVICPIIYGIIGGVIAAIGAAIYNLASGWVGGLQVEIS